MSLNHLRTVVEAFAIEALSLSPNLLESEVYNWDEYVGVRMVHLHTVLTLRDLAGRILLARQQMGASITRTHYALLDHQRAFRDLHALLVDQPETLADVIPAPEEWALRTIVVHVHDVERYFYASISNALAGREPREPTEAEIAEWSKEPETLPADLPLAQSLDDTLRLHERIVARMAQLSDEETQEPSTLWESQPRTILFRMQRWAAHLREHTNQVEKTLRWLDATPSEARMLLRQTWAALAEVEGLSLGAEVVAQALCAEVAKELEQRYLVAHNAIARAVRFVAAIEAGDETTVTTLLAETPDIAYTPLAGGGSPIAFSRYRGRTAIVEALTAANPYPNFHESAILGNAKRIHGYLQRMPQVINHYSRDGYTALQLAAFFGHVEVVRLLLAHGGDPHAVSHNEMMIQPLHAAVAARNSVIVAALIAAGADVDARQQGGFTPLMAAEQNGDEEIIALLKSAGAE